MTDGRRDGISRNWWKYGFFVLLLIAEFEREMIVIAQDPEAKPLVSQSVMSFGDTISAEGQWTRSDEGGKLLPSPLAIECSRERQECIIASYDVNGEFVSRPNLDRFNADVAANEVVIRSDNDCYSLTTRIDVAAREVSQVRQRNEGWQDAAFSDPIFKETCNNLEDRIVSRLVGYDDLSLQTDPLDGHFVPLIKIFVWLINL